MRFLSILLIWLFVFCGISETYGSSSFLQTTLRSTVGVRAMGMGGAFTGVADDAMAAVYNPGGIEEAGFQYYFENSDYKNHQFTRAETYLMQWKNIVFTNWHTRSAKGDSADVYAYTFGRGGSPGWGVTYKRVQDNQGADGYTVDFGFLMNLGSNFKIGVLAQDLFKDHVAASTTLRTGISTRWMDQKLLVACDQEIYRSPEPYLVLHYGLEYTLTPELDIRAGWDAGNFTGGISLMLDFGSIEFGISTPENLNQESTYRIAFDFGRQRKLAESAPSGKAYNPHRLDVRRLQRAY